MSRELVEEKVSRLASATGSTGPYRHCGCGKCGLIFDVSLDAVVAAAMSAQNENYTCGQGLTEEERQAVAHYMATVHPGFGLRVAAVVRAARRYIETDCAEDKRTLDYALGEMDHAEWDERRDEEESRRRVAESRRKLTQATRPSVLAEEPARG